MLDGRRSNPAPTEFPDIARGLSWWVLPPPLARKSVEMCRFINTWADTLFYNVGDLKSELALLDLEVETMPPRGNGDPQKPPSRILSLDASTNPEGALLLIDAVTAPYVHCYPDVDAFLKSEYAETRAVSCVTITGVGSSAYGSAALGWQVSKATAKPVLAIVPGYGLADMVQQALGGWFAFGMHDWLETKSFIQRGLAIVTPQTATIGRNLAATTPGSMAVNAAPVFRTGSGSSDALHAILSSRPGQIRMLVGHSKGALVIGNALKSLPPEATDELAVITLGCPISNRTPGKVRRQVLGRLDGLGMLNAWGNAPTEWELAWHTTNLRLWLPMQAGRVPHELNEAACALANISPGADVLVA